jgi:predicted nucleic acid-binding protein
MARYYVDTCVWIDFLTGRTENDFLIRCIYRQDVIIYSYILEKELIKHVDISRLRMIFSLLSEQLLKIDIEEIQKIEAADLSAERNIPFADALHAILARDNDAIIVTRDKHFESLHDICRILFL